VLGKALEDVGATVLISSRGTLHRLARAGLLPKSVRHAVCYGAPVDRETVEKLTAAGVRVFSAYGTDAQGVVFALGERCSGERGGRIGGPLPGLTLTVRDASGADAPIGVPGDLFVDRGQGLSRTFDVVRWSADGVLEWLRRSDDAVWVDGQLVAPSQASAALAAHPAIDAAAVTPREWDGDARLVAYYVARPGASFTETELRRALREAVAPAVMPAAYVELDEMPRGADGAVDTAKLPPPADEEAGGPDYVPPRTDAERLLAELFAEALGVPRVSALDNFFDLGGYSLLCFKVIARIEERTGKRLSPRLLLLNTLEQVAAQIEVPAAAAAPRVTAPSSSWAAPRSEPRGLLGRLKKIIKG
jgi:hypothetical protein